MLSEETKAELLKIRSMASKIIEHIDGLLPAENIQVAKPERTYRYSADDYALACYLEEEIRKRQSYIKPKSIAILRKWAEEVYRMRTIDKREPDLIRAVIDWSVEDTFWATNILSAPKLRKQFETLLAAIKRERQGQSLI